MKERPILFSGPMVRAILDGRKTVTRRPVKLRGRWVIEQREDGGLWPYDPTWSHGDDGSPWIACPYGQPGDRLWVRETWCYAHPDYHDEAEGRRMGDRPVREYPAPWWCHYAATDDVDEPRWRSPLYMPRWASRITLEVVDVRVERLHDITEEDAASEGVRAEDVAVGNLRVLHEMGHLRYGFATLWERINGPGSWAANPWVWRVEFRRLT